MPRLIEADCHLLLDPSLPPDRAANMPLSLFRAEVGSQPCRDVFDRIPYCHQLDALDRRVFHTRIMIWIVAYPDRYCERANRPLN